MAKWRYNSIILSIVIILSIEGSLYAALLNIHKISVRGNTLFPDSTILSQINSNVDLPYDPELITKDIQKIYDIGFFSSIKVEVEAIAGGVYVTFILEERPLVTSIEFKGNKEFKDEQLEEVLTLRSSGLSDILNLKFYQLKIKEDLEKIKQLYYEAGFYYARVISKLLPDPLNSQQRVILQYSIEEGKKTTVEVQRLLSVILPTVRQKEKLSFEEFQFLEQVLSAFQEGNTRKTAQLVWENREHARIVATFLLKQGEKAYRTRDYEAALDILVISQELYQQFGNTKEHAITLLTLGSIYQAIGEYQQALKFYQESLIIFKVIGNRAGEGTTLNNIGLIYQMIGESQQALDHYQEALTIQKEIGDRAGEGATLNNIGLIYKATGEYQQALNYYQRAIAICKEIGHHAGEVATLHNIGGIYQAIGEYQQALNAYQESLTIFKEIGDRAGEGSTLNSIGGIYKATGEYQQALDSYQEALIIRRAIGDRAGEGTTLNNIGLIYQTIGESQQALNHYQEALTIQRAIGDRAGEGNTLNNIGVIYQATGEYQQALDFYQEALTIRRVIGDRAGEGATLHNIGVIYQATGEYQQAFAFLQEALTIQRAIGDRAGEGATLNNIGAIYEATGKYQQAFAFLQEALTIQRAIGDRIGEGATLNNIGMIYEATGEYQQAFAFLQEALTIQRTMGDHAGEGRTLNNIGAIYEATGRYQQTLSSLQEALTIVKALGDRVGEGTMLTNIGMIYQATGEYQQALDHYQEALTIIKALGDRASEGTILHNIGGNYQATGEYQQALDSYQEALTIAKAIGNRVGEGAILNNIGVIYHTTGEYQQALDSYQEALTIVEAIGDRIGEQKTLSNIGYVYEQQEQWREAVGYYQQAIALLEAIRSKAGGSEAKESFFGQGIDVYPHAGKCLLKLNTPEKAFIYTERSKAKSFLEQLYEASVGVKQGVDKKLLEKEMNLYRKLFVIEQNLKKQLSDGQRNHFLKERNALENELSGLQIKLRTSNSRYAELKYPQPVTVEQIQQEILKEGEVLVEYLQGEEELYVFIIGKTPFNTATLKIGEDFPEKLGEAMDSKEKAYELYQILFQPLEKMIADASLGKDIQHLIIVPDGLLFYLPFELLVTKDGETPEYLVNRYTISYAPSASVLKPEILHARHPEQYTQDLLALAPFGEAETTTAQVAMKATEHLLLSDTLRSGLESVQPLPYSAGEVQTISRLYPQSIFKIGADATKAFFKDHAKGNHYLHLSTHGYLDNQHAMYSGLLFSDGMLQTYEIFNMDIDAELTVLSACETGLGELKAGEGLVGLTRAFMYAGSPSVLVSLWSVSDPSTAAFMKSFYRNLNKGKTKAEALRETKIWMKEKSYHTDEHGNVIKHDHPFYWAPFILVGAHE